MAQQTVDFQREKNRAIAKKLLKKFRIPLALLLVIAVSAAVYAGVGEVRRSNTADFFKSIPKTTGTSSSFPFNEDELSLDKVMMIGEKPLIVSDTGIEVISQNADTLLEYHLNWADTRVESNNGRAFVYSSTSNKAYLISRTAVLASFEQDGQIVTGAVGKNGSVALSYSTDDAQSVVKVYNPRQKLEFEWHCSKEYVSSLSLSPSGDKLLIAAVGVNNAEIYSRILLFKTGKTQPQFDITLSGTSVLKVCYQTNMKLAAVGDNKTVTLNRKGEIKTTVTYADDALYTVDSDKGGSLLLCYKEFGGSKIKITRISGSVGKNREFEIDYLPESADIKGSSIAFAVDNTVNVYSLSGKVKDTYECSQDVNTVLLSNTGIYTLENGSVCKYQR